MQELIPIRRLLLEIVTVMKLGGDETTVIKSTVFEENNGALTIANSVNMTPQTKYIGGKYHLFRHHCGEGSGITLVKVDNILQNSDISTKGMDLEKFIKMRKLVCKW